MGDERGLQMVRLLCAELWWNRPESYQVDAEASSNCDDPTGGLDPETPRFRLVYSSEDGGEPITLTLPTGVPDLEVAVGGETVGVIDLSFETGFVVGDEEFDGPTEAAQAISRRVSELAGTD